MDRFTILHDDNNTFKDYSIIAENFIVDSFLLPLVSAEDHLYIGLYKPFSFVWAEFVTANTQSGELTGEYYNGTSWASLNDFIDRTSQFTKSGFIEWDLDQEDWSEISIDSKTMYWVRFRPSVDLDLGTDLSGINIVYSSDDDLEEEINHIDKHLPSGRTSFIQYHQSVKKDLILKINNMGRKKRGQNKNGFEPVTQFDLLRPEELRMASIYSVLSKIFFNASDNAEDKYYQRYIDYRNKASDAFDLYYITIDTDDDGIVDVSEKNTINRVKVTVL